MSSRHKPLPKAHSIPEFPDFGFLRLKQIVGDRRSTPPVHPIVPVSRSTWWEGVRSGRYPAPIKHGRTTLWRVTDIRALCARISEEGLDGGEGEA